MDGLQLTRYDAARYAVEQARTVDEAKNIADKAQALQAYARQARDPALESWVSEIRIRARRRIGELSLALEPAPRGGKGGSSKSPNGGKFEALKSAGLSKSDAQRCERIYAVPIADFEQAIAERQAQGKVVTADDVVRVLAKREKREAPKAQAALPDYCTVADLQAFAETGVKCATVYADPAWQYGNQGTRASTGDHYVGMSVDEICALPVESLAADDAHLHLWTTNAFLFESKRVMESWGFEYKSCFIWVKPQIGMGNYWRVSHEFLLFGIRGSAPFADRSLRSWGEFPRRKHSAKPEEIRQLIERASPGPHRIELFGRRRAPGWYVWGNEIERAVFDAPGGVE